MAVTFITIEGYFTEYDKWNRLKLMFLDDYDEPDYAVGTKRPLSFTKTYMMNKLKTMTGKSPISDDGKYMTINCPKKVTGSLYVDNQTQMINIIPMAELRQNKVQCIVSIKQYNFKKDGESIRGWNINLSAIKLL
jgi:hypothetical protein